MKTNKFILLLSLPIILAFTLQSHAFASHDLASTEDSGIVCREGNTLIFRIVSHEYLCTSPSTAASWVKLGLAEIIHNATTVGTPKISNPEPVETPFPKKTLSPVSDIAKCRDGNTLVFRFTHHDTFCTSPSTAASWVKLGLAEIIHESQPVEEKPYITTEIEDKNQENYPTKSDIKTSVSDKKNLILPSYPNQPSINPELLATNDYRYPPAIHKVNERIWVAVGYDSANSVMIEGEKGIIIIDTLSTYESAKNVINEFRKITDKPVKTIIYTSGNSEYVGGARAFLEEGDDHVEIISQNNNLNFFINQNIILGQITALRSHYAAGLFLPEEGSDKNDLANITKITSTAIAYVPPTDTFSDEFNLDISGVKMNLVHVGGESSDQIYVWLPDDRALLIGDDIYGTFPNIYTIRGAAYHNPMDYVNALDKVIQLEPEFLVSSHVKPIIGKENTGNVLVSTRDATQYIYDKTILGMNKGYSADELSQTIKLPAWFNDNPGLTQSRGQIPWYVKQIYYGNLGWFEGDPAFMLPISMDERSKKIVEGFGGIKKLLSNIQDSIKQGEYEWAAELATYALHVEPENEEAKMLKAHALRVIGQRMLSADGRNWSLTSALELEGKIITNSNAHTRINLEQLAEIPIEQILRSLPTKFDPKNIVNPEDILNVYYSDIEKGFTLHFTNGILVVTEGLHKNPDQMMTMDSNTHKLIMTGQKKLTETVNSGDIKIDGDVEDVQELLDMFDPFTINE